MAIACTTLPTDTVPLTMRTRQSNRLDESGGKQTNLGKTAKDFRGNVSAWRSMPRYFFTIHREHQVENDPDGVFLPDVAAALSYAEYTIREQRKNSGYNDPALMMMIMDEARQTVLSLPFFPGQ